MRLQILAAGLLAAASLSAQSPLITTFAANNNGSVGGGVYFDITVSTPITIIGLDVDLADAAGTVGSIDVFTCPGTRTGNQTNIGAWTQVSTGAVTAAGYGLHSTVAISAIPLAAGSYGMAFRANGVANAYTNGNGTNQTYSTTELTLNAGEASNAAFTAPLFTPRVVNTQISYSLGTSGTVATRTPYGTGCYAQFTSFYENFSAPATFDLDNSSMTLVAGGSGGYVAVPGITGYVAPSPAAVATAIGDDVESVVTLGAPFPYAGGSTPTLNVCSNGFVSVASNGTSFSPAVGTMLAFTNTSWGGWHDYYPVGGTSGNVMFEQVGSVAYVTWLNVVDFGGTVPNTWQLQFDTATGNVTYAWQTMSHAGSAQLVYYSPGGPSLDPGNRDISATLPGTFALSTTDNLPLAFAAGSRPLIGTSVSLDTSNIPVGTAIGATVLGLVQINPGLDLSFLGMPGCFQYTNPSVSQVFLVAGPTASTSLVIPNNNAFIGIHVFGQSATFTSGFNAFGVIASNGVDLGIGNL